jgi:hypothetical protein
MILKRISKWRQSMMIITRLTVGLGNLMFQYAFGFATSMAVKLKLMDFSYEDNRHENVNRLKAGIDDNFELVYRVLNPELCK